MNKTLLYILIAVIVVIVGTIGFTMTRGRSNQPRQAPISENDGSSQPANTQQNQTAATNTVQWQQRENGWQAMGTPPACPDPIAFTFPSDINQATGILYPGQTRGGNYKPHGGVRFDNSTDNKIAVAAPIDGNVVRGARYLVDGEMQYTFDIINSCGIMYRLGHLLVLTPKFQKIADDFPAASEGDSRTEQVQPQIAVTTGEAIATSVGVTKGGINTFFDWGVYDLRTKNEASKDAAWAVKPEHDAELAQHAVCWFDWLTAADEAKVRSLPAGDPTSGKTSDYCK